MILFIVVAAVLAVWAAVAPFGGQMGAWLAHIALPLMRELFDPEGTFVGCTAAKGHNPAATPLPMHS